MTTDEDREELRRHAAEKFGIDTDEVEIVEKNGGLVAELTPAAMRRLTKKRAGLGGDR